MFDRYGRVHCEACGDIMKTVDVHRGEALLRCPGCNHSLVLRWPKKFSYKEARRDDDQVAA